MLSNLMYKFQQRDSKKNLKKQIKELDKQFNNLRKETLGNNSLGYVTFYTYGVTGNSRKAQSDDSLQGQLRDLREYLGIDYAESELSPKPKKKADK